MFKETAMDIFKEAPSKKKKKKNCKRVCGISASDLYVGMYSVHHYSFNTSAEKTNYELDVRTRVKIIYFDTGALCHQGFMKNLHFKLPW